MRAGATLIAVAVAIGVLACADGFAARDLAGTYLVRSVDGQPLPVLYADGAPQAKAFTSDTLELRIDGTVAEVTYVSHSGGYNVYRTSGTWTVRGKTISVSYAEGGLLAAQTVTGPVHSEREFAISPALLGRNVVYTRP